MGKSDRATGRGELTSARRRGVKHRIYCAGPLFNRAEREEMAEIGRTLEAAGFSTFLPHRDGFLFADVHREFLRAGYDPAEASRMIQQAIFWLDAYEVIAGCKGLVLNMNGRVPDEGAVAETAMAWMAGKPTVLYKSDSRSLIQGNDNPLLLGLGNFVRVSTIPEVAYAFGQLFRVWRPPREPLIPQAVRKTVEHGRRLSGLLTRCKSPADMVPVVVGLTRLPPQASNR